MPGLFKVAFPTLLVQKGAEPRPSPLQAHCSSILSPQAHLLVVIENDHHVAVGEARVVHGLIGHTPSDGAITNHRDHLGAEWELMRRRGGGKGEVQRTSSEAIQRNYLMRREE